MLLTAENLRKNYGMKQLLDGVTLYLNQGERIGLIGVNGTGKSTLLKILAGAESPDEGRVALDPNVQVSYLPQTPALNDGLTVLEQVFAGHPADFREINEYESKTILTKLGIADFDRKIGELSGGQRKRVALATVFVHPADVLILDEPTVGLDPKQIIDIRNLIKSLGKKHTIILSSHILPEVQAICSRVIVINNGKIVADDTAENLSKNLSTDHRFTVRIEGPESDVYRLLSTIPVMKEVTTLGEKEPGSFDYIIESKPDTDCRREMFKRLSERNFPILSLRSSELTLEDIFLQLTDSKSGGAK